MLYTTPEKLGAYLGIAVDSEAEALIKRASAIVDSVLGISQGTESETIQWSGTSRVVLKAIPLSGLTVTSGSNTIEVKKKEWYVVYLEREIGRHETVVAEYSSHPENAPADLEAFFLEYCRSLYVASLAGASEGVVTNKKIGDLSVTFASPSEMLDACERTLNSPYFSAIASKYKKLPFAF